MYEIYEVPTLELDGTEMFLEEAETLEEANKLFEELALIHNNLWIIICSDAKGYEKVVRT